MSVYRGAKARDKFILIGWKIFGVKLECTMQLSLFYILLLLLLHWWAGESVLSEITFGGDIVLL